MNLFYTLVIVEQTIWIPVVFCLVRWQDVKPLYLPLFLYLLAKWVSEMVANMMAHYGRYNAPPYNVFYLLEALLLTWQLYKLGAFGKNKRWYTFLQVFWVLLWLADIIFTGSFFQFNIIHHTTYSFVLLFVSAGLLSKQAITVRNNIFRNTVFWLSVVFTIWLMYNIMYEFAEYISSHKPSLQNITKKVTTYVEYAAAITYFMIAWAIYCIPKKPMTRFDQKTLFNK